VRTLKFSIDKQILTKQGDFTGLVAGSKGYLQAQFSFSADWAGHRKVAVFTANDGTEYNEPIEAGLCRVPDDVAACASFKVHVVGRRGDATPRTSRVTIIQRRY
jgi:hypothetical protein